MIKELLNLLRSNFMGQNVCVAIHGFTGTLKLYENVDVNETDTYIILGNLLNSDYIWIGKEDIIEFKDGFNTVDIKGMNGETIIELV